MHDDSTTNSDLSENLESCDGVLNLYLAMISKPLLTEHHQTDVSSSIARDYDIIYKHTPGQSPEELAIQAAAHMVSEQQKADVLLSGVPEEVEDEVLSNTAMSIASLLNPVTNSSNNQDVAKVTNFRSNKQAVKVLVLNDQNGTHLANTSLLDIRAVHDSQVKKHHGNERARKNVDELIKKPGNKLKPSECSKLVAVVMKSMEVTPTGVSRIHRWNIAVKLNLSRHIKNTSMSLDLPSEATITGGGISARNPIEYGKFVVIIKNGVSSR